MKVGRAQGIDEADQGERHGENRMGKANERSVDKDGIVHGQRIVSGTKVTIIRQVASFSRSQQQKIIAGLIAFPVNFRNFDRD